jgi:hypothetical protein
MEKEFTDRLARIETKLDLMVPHFEEGGSISKLTKLRAEFDMAKKILGGLWATLIAYLSYKK